MARPKRKKLVEVAALITGFPGFLATYLLEELIERQPDGTFWFLVEPRFAGAAAERLGQIRDEHPDFSGRFEVITGDITDERLGLTANDYAQLTKEVGVVWHLAAIYDLAVPEVKAYQVNVGGTNHVLDFCEACSDFRRLNYISTCFVSGERQGTVYETELDEGQSHHNHYESTKFWAEVEVRRRMETDDLPATILRPAMVVGHSRTGQTEKYDGPYYLLRMLRKYPDWLPFPNIGTGESLANIVPVDFVAQACATIGLDPDAPAQTFHIADSNPMRAKDIVALALELMHKAPPMGRVPPRLVEALLGSDSIEELVGVPREVARYFTQNVRYDTRNCQEALEGTDVWCPHLSTYLQVLLDYVDLNPEQGFMDNRRI